MHGGALTHLCVCGSQRTTGVFLNYFSTIFFLRQGLSPNPELTTSARSAAWEPLRSVSLCSPALLLEVYTARSCFEPGARDSNSGIYDYAADTLPSKPCPLPFKMLFVPSANLPVEDECIGYCCEQVSKMELSHLGLQYLQPSVILYLVGVDQWLPSSVWNTRKMKQFSDWAVRTVASVYLNKYSSTLSCLL